MKEIVNEAAEETEREKIDCSNYLIYYRQISLPILELNSVKRTFITHRLRYTARETAETTKTIRQLFSYPSTLNEMAELRRERLYFNFYWFSFVFIAFEKSLVIDTNELNE